MNVSSPQRAATVEFLPLRRQTAEVREELDLAVSEVLDASRFVLGEPAERFERAFARYCCVGHAIGVASGADAITIALLALGVGSGDEVITAGNTCLPTVAAIAATGATPVLVDPDPETLTLDPSLLPRAVSGRTAAIVPVHLYGQCADMDQIGSFARTHHLAVVEDAAQAHGAKWKEQAAGTFGEAGAFSFYPTKNLGAAGDAGAIVTGSDDLAKRCRALRGHAGRHSRLDALQAAILDVKLRHLDDWNARRRALAAYYQNRLRGSALSLPSEDPHGKHVFHLFMVRTSERSELRRQLARHGVETRVHYELPIHRHAEYRDLPRAGDLEVSERVSHEVLSLPLHAHMTRDEAERVVETLRR